MKSSKLIERHAVLTRALLAELKRLVDALAERLTPAPDGRRRILRAAAVKRLREFLVRLREVDAGAWPELERLTAEAREVLDDWQPQELRNLTAARQEVADGLARLSRKLTPLVAVPPKEAADAPIPSRAE
jgi:hypothetical protein